MSLLIDVTSFYSLSEKIIRQRPRNRSVFMVGVSPLKMLKG